MENVLLVIRRKEKLTRKMIYATRALYLVRDIIIKKCGRKRKESLAIVFEVAY